MLPNWLYGKSKSKLASILGGGGGTPADYDEVKAQVTQNTEDIALLDQDSVTWDNLSEVGAVNFLNHNAHNAVENGITFTVNPDRSVTANGTAIAEEWLLIAQNVAVSESVRASGCPKGGTPSTYFMMFSQGGNSNRECGDGVIIPSGTISSVYLVIKPNATVNNIVFKPMIAPVSYNGPYVPYSMTNQELTEKLTADANLDAAVDLSTYAAYSNMYTAPSDGYVHFKSAASGSTARTIYTYGNNTTAATDPHFTHSTSANNKAFEIFIKKGLKIYVDGLQSGDTINFYPLT